MVFVPYVLKEIGVSLSSVDIHYAIDVLKRWSPVPSVGAVLQIDLDCPPESFKYLTLFP